MGAKALFKFLFLTGMALALAACAGEAGPEGPAGPVGPAGPQGPAGAAGNAAELDVSQLSCTECHNDTTIIWSKEAQFREASVHGTGQAFIRGESTNCAGCHGHEGAKARISAGLPPHDESVAGITNVSPYDCRTCHQIHTSYTGNDWALTGDAQPVQLEYSPGTYDGGDGNLCSNCHQSRNEFPVLTLADGAEYEVTSNRFGPHYGIEAQMMLGEGAFFVDDDSSPHYENVTDTCVGCHMGEERNHTYEAEVERCQACHSDAENFDIDGTQTEVMELLEELKALLIDAGIVDLELDPEGARTVTGFFPEEVVAARWNYMMVYVDHSFGVHNPSYIKGMLEASIAALSD
ncbi:MAG TPA: cytochrome c3 family protein [Acidimicrobiia bacterium]